MEDKKMAKATAICTCKMCGKKFEMTAQKYNRKDANDWEEWAKAACDVCPQCYAKQKAAEEAEKPLALNVGFDPMTVDYPVILWFSGNTMPKKDDIKKLGYMWGSLHYVGILGAMTIHSLKRWYKCVSVNEYKAQINNAKAICGESVVYKYTAADLEAYKDTVAKKNEKSASKQKELDELGPCPQRPIWMPEGRWNGKVYGKSALNIYVDNSNIEITKEQAEEAKAYTLAVDDWTSKRDTIRHKYLE